LLKKQISSCTMKYGGADMKILASDLDGTLYFGDQEHKLKPQDVEAIKQFQKEGNLFGICSGRTLAGIHHALDGLDVTLDFYILVSGASLARKDGTYIYQHLLSKSLISKIVDLVKEYDASILFCHDEDYFRFERNIKNDHIAKVISNMDEVPFETYDSLHMAFSTMTELEKVKQLLIEKLGGEIEVHHNVLNLDITPKNCSKGIAIKTLDQYLPVKYEDIYVIGDSYNDISMFEAAKTAFSFHRSDVIVKEKATHLVDDIAEAIKEMNQHA